MVNSIDTLRKFFAVSVATFEAAHAVRIAFGLKDIKTYTHRLHLLAKQEIEKTNPDMEYIIAVVEATEDEYDEDSKKVAIRPGDQL